MNTSHRNLGRWGVALALNCVATVSPALTNPANGHDYQLINQVMTWAQGNAYCASQGGYLATITSLNEQNFVYNLCAGKSFCFLGGWQPSGWRWITGEPWTYSHWKPDSGDGDDPVLGMYGVMGSSRSAYPSFWNDVTTNYPGFAICEWNTPKVALTLNKVGEGTVTAQGINCGSDCSEEYPANTQVKLIATPANGYQFANWSGDCVSDTVTMDKAKSCTATFSPTVTNPTNGCDTVTDGLVACYPFDGDANDHSGNGNHGIIQGGLNYSILIFCESDQFGKFFAYVKSYN